MGAALIQDNRPIAFASKTLTDVETRYANIERECLSVVFGLEKFHTYIYGCHITIYNDHKPLEMIQKKPIHTAPPRLQRMLLRLQKYDYNIVYRPGKEMTLADRLSRFPSRSENLPIELHHNIQHITFTSDKTNIIRGATERDPILYTVYRITHNGWPSRFHEVPRIAHQYWGARDELTIDNGLLLKGERVCIPPELYQRTLHDLHEGHKGIEKMQHLAREKIYWPGLDADIIEYVKHCTICTKHKATQATQPMIPRDIPEGPWQDLAADFFHHNNSEYILIADTFSKYPFLHKVSSKAAESVTKRIKSLISQYGPPKTLSTDNGPPFSSEAFAQFMSKEHIEHITSSPLYPRSNGFIECQIKTIKTALSTCQESKQSIEDLLLNIRTQPIGPHLPSPREILHNRTENRPGRPSQPVNMEDIRNYLISKKTTQKENYDKHHNTKPLPDITPGQKVLFLSPAEPNQFIEGTITSHASTPRSYIIESQGRSYRRNRQHIRPLNPIITRPSPDSNTVITRPSPDSNTIITRPSPTQHQPDSHVNPTITRPSPAPPAEQQSDSYTKLNISGPSATRESPPNTKPTISRPPTSKPIPAPRRKFLTRPLEQNQRYTSTTTNFDQILAHLTAINQPQALEQTHEDQIPESSPSSPATTSTDPETETTSTESTTDTSSDTGSSDETTSTSSDISTTSTLSDCQLRPRYPINYNENVLTKLHGLPQIKTFNNLLIPLPVTESESEEDENYEHSIKPDT